jgi:hypothetical protein
MTFFISFQASGQSAESFAAAAAAIIPHHGGPVFPGMDLEIAAVSSPSNARASSSGGTVDMSLFPAAAAASAAASATSDAVVTSHHHQQVRSRSAGVA